MTLPHAVESMTSWRRTSVLPPAGR